MGARRPQRKGKSMTITAPTELANEILESTGFNYDITETENDGETTTLTFDSAEDARKFQAMLDTPPEQWQTLEWADDEDQTEMKTPISTCCSCGFQWRTGENGGHSCAGVLNRELNAYKEAFDAAKAFIECNVACPDITAEMRRNYEKYKEASKACMPT
jgi:dihydroorotate dehydrogenase